MNQENYQNSEKIAQILSEKYQNKDLSKVKVLDICCGVFDQKGSGYDVKGEIYQPLVAQKLGQLGFDVTGVDFREGEILRSAQDDLKDELRLKGLTTDFYGWVDYLRWN